MKIKLLKESFENYMKQQKRLSNCCGAPPLGGILDKHMEDEKTVYTGRCSKCKDGAAFLTQAEMDAEDAGLQEHHGEAISDSLKNMRLGDFLNALENDKNQSELYASLEAYLQKLDANTIDATDGNYEDDGQPDDYQENSDFAQDDDWHNMSAADMMESKKSVKSLLKPQYKKGK